MMRRLSVKETLDEPFILNDSLQWSEVIKLCVCELQTVIQRAVNIVMMSVNMLLPQMIIPTLQP